MGFSSGEDDCTCLKTTDEDRLSIGALGVTDLTRMEAKPDFNGFVPRVSKSALEAAREEALALPAISLWPAVGLLKSGWFVLVRNF